MTMVKAGIFLVGFGAGATVALATDPGVLLQEKLTAWAGEGASSGIAAAWVDESGVRFAFAGRFSADNARDISADTYFEIGSLTKAFTGALLARAVHENKLSLDERIGAPFAGAATYGQLATHTAGLPLMVPRAPGAHPGPADMDELQAGWAALASLQPGTVRYSNFGYAVLGHATAARWEMSYPEALRTHVLLPLGLTETETDWRAVPRERLAPGHHARGPAPNLDFRAEVAAGGLVTTVRDLAAFVQAQLGLGERRAPWLALTQESRTPTGRPAQSIGFAWLIEQGAHGRLLELAGGTAGYRSYIAFAPDRRTGLVLLANSSARALEEPGRELARQLLFAGDPLNAPDRAR